MVFIISEHMIPRHALQNDKIMIQLISRKFNAIICKWHKQQTSISDFIEHLPPFYQGQILQEALTHTVHKSCVSLDQQH